MRDGAGHFQSWRGQTPRGWLRQFVHGLSLPFHIVREVLRTPEAQRRYLRVCLTQTAATLLVALVFTGVNNSDNDSDDDVPRKNIQAQVEKQRKRADLLRQRARARAQAKDPKLEAAALATQRSAEALADGGSPLALAQAISALVQEATRSAAESAQQEHDASGTHGPQAGATPLEGEALPAPSTAPPHANADDERPHSKSPEADSDDGEDDNEDGADLDEAINAAANSLEARIDKPPSHGFTTGSLAFWAALFGTMHIAQWIVLALSRDYHTAIARDASLLTGVPPEDDDFSPRVRLNTVWLRSKLKRRIRALLHFAVGLPFAALVAAPFPFKHEVFTTLSSLWGLWWLCVYTTAKSARAWENPTPRDPWFLRGWDWVTTHVPGFRWGLPRAYGRLLRRLTQEVRSPMAAMERLPWSYAGLALVRFVGSVPPLKFFTRPLIPVSSAHLLVAQNASKPIAPEAISSAEATLE
ncbi:hypothetical protein DRW03_01800 [Corallococcus sp. H22C18031201]|nr:hypothetical protein DRW03_01800 [Corallococcus sp. H22C18031201]